MKTTPVYDSYWKLAARRQEMFHRRLAGHPSPWTDDPILEAHRFTNAYRASDRVSQYLIKHVIYTGERTSTETVFRILLFKFFNKVETWEGLVEGLGFPTWESYDFERYAARLDEMMASSQIYTAAYILPSPPFGSPRKHRNHLKLIEHMMKDEVAKKAFEAPSLEALHNLLLSYPSMGNFLAFQMAIDINYSDVTNFSEMDFVVPGPGALNGIRKCFADRGGLSEPEIIKYMSEHQEEEFQRLGLTFHSLWGRPLQLIDCQNLFCEIDKYARIAHPEYNTGRSRIKQSFRPNRAPLPQWYPPKWGLNPKPIDIAPLPNRQHSLEDFGL